MKSTNSLLWALVAALTLFLAGCGGGSSNTGAGDMPDPEPTPVEQAQAAYDKAKAAEMAAMTARTTAKTQLDAAKLANAYDIYSTGGDSSMVRANAAAVMTAKAAAEKALADAKAEKMKIDEALKALNDVVAGTTGLEAQKKVVDQQSKDVAAQIKLIEGYLRTINGYAAAVDTEAKIKALAGETPAGADPEGRIAQVILNALSPFDASNSAPKVGGKELSGLNVRGEAIPPTKVVPATPSDHTMDDGRSKFYVRYDTGDLPAGVMTWEQIAGAENLMKKAFGANNMDVDVLPLAGMPLSSLTGSDGTPVTALPTFTNGKAETQYYKGIKGTLHCQAPCAVEGGNLTGSLYFEVIGESGNQSDYFWMEPDKSYYTPYGAYVRYGYWLYETGVTTGVRVLSQAFTAYIGDINSAASATLPGTATYKGSALGLSVLKTYTAGEHTGQKSGQFTADVTLNAKFGASRELGGVVDNFRGSAVDEDWSVEFQKNAGNVYFWVSTGVAQGADGSQAGIWQGYPFNQDGVGRPAGFHGNFNAHFKNGHAFGAYSTRMTTE